MIKVNVESFPYLDTYINTDHICEISENPNNGTIITFIHGGSITVKETIKEILKEKLG